MATDTEYEMTPDEAAGYVGVSRPLLTRMLNGGLIPARNKPGSSHRMIAVADLDAYLENKASRQHRLSEAMNATAEQDLYLPGAKKS